MRLPSATDLLRALRSWRPTGVFGVRAGGSPSLLARARARAAAVGGTPVIGPAVSTLASFLRAVTSQGWGCAIALVLTWWLATTRHWLEAWTVTTALASLLLIAVAWSIGRTSYRVTVDLASRRVVVGEPALGNVTLTNPATRTIASSTIEMPVGAGLAVFHVPRLGAGQEHEEVFTIPTRRRGVVVVGPVTSVRGDALGLMRRTQRWTDPVDLYVHPRTVVLDSAAIGLIRDVEGAVTQELSSSDVSFHALRDYVAGDDRRHVHWRSTARTGRLMVRQFEETRRAHLLVVLDLDEAAWGSDEDFETAVGCAASLIVATMREHREATLVTQDGIPLIPTASRALDALTLVETRSGCEDLVTLTRTAAKAVPQASVAALLTGAVGSTTALHRAHAELPLSVVSFALRADAANPLSSVAVGGMRVLTLPALEELPLAMRRASA